MIEFVQVGEALVLVLATAAILQAVLAADEAPQGALRQPRPAPEPEDLPKAA